MNGRRQFYLDWAHACLGGAQKDGDERNSVASLGTGANQTVDERQIVAKLEQLAKEHTGKRPITDAVAIPGAGLLAQILSQSANTTSSPINVYIALNDIGFIAIVVEIEAVPESLAAWREVADNVATLAAHVTKRVFGEDMGSEQLRGVKGFGDAEAYLKGAHDLDPVPVEHPPETPRGAAGARRLLELDVLSEKGLVRDAGLNGKPPHMNDLLSTLTTRRIVSRDRLNTAVKTQEHIFRHVRPFVSISNWMALSISALVGLFIGFLFSWTAGQAAPEIHRKVENFFLLHTSKYWTEYANFQPALLIFIIFNIIIAVYFVVFEFLFNKKIKSELSVKNIKFYKAVTTPTFCIILAVLMAALAAAVSGLFSVMPGHPKAEINRTEAGFFGLGLILVAAFIFFWTSRHQTAIEKLQVQVSETTGKRGYVERLTVRGAIKVSKKYLQAVLILAPAAIAGLAALLYADEVPGVADFGKRNGANPASYLKVLENIGWTLPLLAFGILAHVWNKFSRSEAVTVMHDVVVARFGEHAARIKADAELVDRISEFEALKDIAKRQPNMEREAERFEPKVKYVSDIKAAVGRAFVQRSAVIAAVVFALLQIDPLKNLKPDEKELTKKPTELEQVQLAVFKALDACFDVANPRRPFGDCLASETEPGVPPVVNVKVSPPDVNVDVTLSPGVKGKVERIAPERYAATIPAPLGTIDVNPDPGDEAARTRHVIDINQIPSEAHVVLRSGDGKLRPEHLSQTPDGTAVALAAPPPKISVEPAPAKAPKPPPEPPPGALAAGADARHEITISQVRPTARIILKGEHGLAPDGRTESGPDGTHVTLSPPAPHVLVGPPPAPTPTPEPAPGTVRTERGQPHQIEISQARPVARVELKTDTPLRRIGPEHADAEHGDQGAVGETGNVAQFSLEAPRPRLEVRPPSPALSEVRTPPADFQIVIRHTNPPRVVVAARPGAGADVYVEGSAPTGDGRAPTARTLEVQAPPPKFEQAGASGETAPEQTDHVAIVVKPSVAPVTVGENAVVVGKGEDDAHQSTDPIQLDPGPPTLVVKDRRSSENREADAVCPDGRSDCALERFVVAPTPGEIVIEVPEKGPVSIAPPKAEDVPGALAVRPDAAQLTLELSPNAKVETVTSPDIVRDDTNKATIALALGATGAGDTSIFGAAPSTIPEACDGDERLIGTFYFVLDGRDKNALYCFVTGANDNRQSYYISPSKTPLGRGEVDHVARHRERYATREQQSARYYPTVCQDTDRNEENVLDLENVGTLASSRAASIAAPSIARRSAFVEFGLFGFADSTGLYRTNLRISQTRARAVEDLLRSPLRKAFDQRFGNAGGTLKVTPDLTPIGLGEERRADPTTSRNPFPDHDAADSRRVEVRVCETSKPVVTNYPFP